ncbi:MULTISPECIES: class I SAM-dependent methyltransferase [unclassified Mesorhizobium]|uniref:class I SAM-dependent methyltransferase n=1 Tax=unclassified Mesorhizobium TaxID=325217 RepID=UPI000BAF6B8F|nr:MULTISPECIES: class I SAM-dependent methyltransferase [unclassified Mesorhizobium]PBC23462.1 SAM-dependent methyltransferase [Mesorhizobium sp. WSM4311]TRD06827.1 class I SAM-dependent methyltransferase [Mesorhizobium sp. WSM4305]
MKDDPPDLWSGAYAGQYEDANYGSGLAGYVMRRSHELVEKPFDSNVTFERVIEVGAGSGFHLHSVRHRFNEYVLTDFSADMLQNVGSASRQGNVTVLAQDATALSFADASFDRLIAAHVLEHLYRPQEVLREWVRVLRPGATLSLVLPCDPGMMWRLGRNFGPRQKARQNGLAYDYVMAREHVNAISNLVAFIRYYFDRREEYWWPARVPSIDLNLIYAVNIKV